MKLINKEDLQSLARVSCGVVNKGGRFTFTDYIDITPLTLSDICPMVCFWEGEVTCEVDIRLEFYATS